MHDDQFSWDENSFFNDNEQHLKKNSLTKKKHVDELEKNERKSRSFRLSLLWISLLFKYPGRRYKCGCGKREWNDGRGCAHTYTHTSIIESITIERTTKPWIMCTKCVFKNFIIDNFRWKIFLNKFHRSQWFYLCVYVWCGLWFLWVFALTITHTHIYTQSTKYSVLSPLVCAYYCCCLTIIIIIIISVSWMLLSVAVHIHTHSQTERECILVLSVFGCQFLPMSLRCILD